MARNTFNEDEELDSPFRLKDFKRILIYIKPFRKQIWMTLLTILVANIAVMIGPYLTKIVIDESIPTKNYTQLVLLCIIFLLSIIVTGLCMRYRIRKINQIGQDMLENMRLDLFTHLQKLPFTYYDSRPHGKILIRVVNYINSLSDLLSNGLINLISDCMSLFVAIGFMLFIDFKLTLYSLVLVPFLMLIVWGIKNAQRRSFQRLSNKQSNLNAYVHESITGIKVTQSFAREEENLQIFDQVSNGYRSSWMKAMVWQFLLWPSVHNIATITTCLIYFIGIKGLGVDISTGVLIAFVGYIGNFWNPIINIGTFYNALITGVAYLERIFETMDEKPDVIDKEDAYVMPSIEGEVVFKNVHFSYNSEKTVLKNVNFTVHPGETIALVGPTGAGKSTIINLLSRFYNINEGEVRIDGHNTADVTLHSLRSQMGVMLQDTFIFSGTIMDNIRYGKLDATDEEVINAAKAVKADDFIVPLKEGYYTEVKERGSTLSAGQRQLISFARALLADPKILILDEATSSIDTNTEIALQLGLDKLLQGRTSFIIAHRLSTIKNANRIFYIDHGNIQEQGNHQHLMELNGLYHALYNSQFTFLKAN